MTFDARAYLTGLGRFGMRPGLRRIALLLDRLDHPERGLDCIHVVGTNGKSSTVRFAAAALQASGIRTGAFVSPYVHVVEEKLQLDGEPVPPDTFDAVVQRVAALEPGLRRELGEGPTQFEVLTAAALVLFAERGVGCAVLEAGLGGRLDSTNVVAARVVGLTNVSLDHTDVLGDTPEAILDEKLGVVHPGALLLCGELDDALWVRAAETAHARGALGARRLRPTEIAAEANTVPGTYQRANAALALALASVWLAPRRFDREAARRALPGATPSGRLELRPGEPPVLLDGAHNPAGMVALTGELDRVLGARRPRVAVVGMQADKAAAEMLAALAPHVDAVVATTSATERAREPAAVLALAAAAGLPGEAVEDAGAALEAARRRAGPGGAVIVTGSLYLLSRAAGTQEGVVAAAGSG